jgi:hypothetical protein
VSESAEALLKLAGQATRVLVVDGASYDPRHRKSNVVLADERDQDSIRLLLRALDTVETDRLWMTPGRPTLAFLTDRRLLVAVTCIGPDYIRCPDLFKADRRVRYPDQLSAWLDQRGIGTAPS